MVYSTMREMKERERGQNERGWLLVAGRGQQPRRRVCSATKNSKAMVRGEPSTFGSII